MTCVAEIVESGDWRYRSLNVWADVRTYLLDYDDYKSQDVEGGNLIIHL